MTAQTRSKSPSLDEIADDDDPRIQQVYKRLRVLTLIGGLTMGVGFMAVMSVIAYRLVKSSPGAGAPVAGHLSITPGARVLSTAAGDGRLLVTVEDGGRTVVYVLDASTLKETGRLDIAPGGPATAPLR